MSEKEVLNSLLNDEGSDKSDAESDTENDPSTTAYQNYLGSIDGPHTANNAPNSANPSPPRNVANNIISESDFTRERDSANPPISHKPPTTFREKFKIAPKPATQKELLDFQRNAEKTLREQSGGPSEHELKLAEELALTLNDYRRRYEKDAKVRERIKFKKEYHASEGVPQLQAQLFVIRNVVNSSDLPDAMRGSLVGMVDLVFGVIQSLNIKYLSHLFYPKHISSHVREQAYSGQYDAELDQLAIEMSFMSMSPQYRLLMKIGMGCLKVYQDNKFGMNSQTRSMARPMSESAKKAFAEL